MAITITGRSQRQSALGQFTRQQQIAQLTPPGMEYRHNASGMYPHTQGFDLERVIRATATRQRNEYGLFRDIGPDPTPAVIIAGSTEAACFISREGKVVLAEPLQLINNLRLMNEPERIYQNLRLLFTCSLTLRIRQAPEFQEPVCFLDLPVPIQIVRLGIGDNGPHYNSCEVAIHYMIPAQFVIAEIGSNVIEALRKQEALEKLDAGSPRRQVDFGVLCN